MAVGLPAGVKEVQRVAAPGGGYYVLGSDGGVFAISDEQGKTPTFYGSVPGLKGDTLAGQHQFGAGGLELNPTGGYTLTDSAGRKYGFDTNFARGQGLQVPDASNTLTTDPSYMAFMRASGLGLETAANQVRQQTAAINAARETGRGDINYAAENQARTTKGGYESRGILRSSNTQQALDRVERERVSRQDAADTDTATKIGALNQSLASQVAAQQNKAAELGLSTTQQQDFDAQINSLKQKYPEYYAGGGK